MTRTGAPAPHLLTPLNVAGRVLPNRVAMAPMTREQAPGGLPTPAMADYYARRAAGGVGLIITEGVAVNRAGSFGSRVPRLYGPEAVAGWQQVVTGVQAHGSLIIAQLWHVGAFCPSLIGMEVSWSAEAERLSPSGLAAPGRPFGRAMTIAEIEATIADFAAAAQAARAAGFDGIELHGAHGYLIDQFLWADTNQRGDRYGGTAERRLAFALELVRAVRAATSPDFLVSFRLSQWKQLDYAARLADDPHQLAAIVVPLAEAGVDLFHASTRRFWEPEFAGDPRNLAAWVRALTGKPAMTVGSVTLGTDFKEPDGKIRADVALDHLDLIEAGLARGDWDLVAIGRALLANPDWVRLVAAGRADALKVFEKPMLDQLQ